MPKTDEEIKAEEDQKIVDDKTAADKAVADEAAKEAAKGETYDIIVNGEKKSFSLEELKSAASKASGADVKFQEASKIRLEAEKGNYLLSLADELKKENPSEETVKKFVQALGVSNDGVAEIMEKISGKTEKKSTEKKQDEKISVDQLPKEVTEILEAAKNASYDKLREEIYADVKKGIDKDEILGKMVDELPEGDRKKVQEMLYDMAKKDVQRKILGNEQFGPEMVVSTVQGIRNMTKTLGMPTSTGTPVPVVGRGLSTDLTPEIVANKLIERVSSTDPEYIDKIVARTLQKQYQEQVKDARKQR